LEFSLKAIPQEAALLVVDMQLGFDDPSWGARNNPDVERQVARLLAAWRAAAARIIHVHHHSRGLAGSFRPGTRGCEPKPEAIPLNGEAIYYKVVNSAFIGTTLESDLRALKVQTLVVVGLTTNHCVSTTVRMAGNLGFQTYVVADATATFPRPGADGRARSAEDVHNAALGDLHQEFAEVVDTRAAIRRFASHEWHERCRALDR
jgi:nicotinamidase-related amidase